MTEAKDKKRPKHVGLPKGVGIRDDKLYFSARFRKKQLYTTKIKTMEEGGRCYDIIQLLLGKGHSKLNYNQSKYSALDLVNLRCKVSGGVPDKAMKAILSAARIVERKPLQEEEIVRSVDTQLTSECLKVDDKTEDLKSLRTSAVMVWNLKNLKSPFDGIPITEDDVMSLGKGGWLTMGIVDFFLEYLRKLYSPSIKLHICNSFLFQFIEEFYNGGSSRYKKVAEWVGEKNIFDFSYVFIPVITEKHWSLFILCDIGTVESRRSRVLHLDSLQARRYHSGVGKMIKTFLVEESKRHRNPVDHSERLEHLEIETVEVPQQPNDADCGVYLLHYAKCFMEEMFRNTLSGKTPGEYSFLKSNWFDTKIISSQRVIIQETTLGICANHPPTASDVAFTSIDTCLRAARDKTGQRREEEDWRRLPYLGDEFDVLLEGFLDDLSIMSEITGHCSPLILGHGEKTRQF